MIPRPDLRPARSRVLVTALALALAACAPGAMLTPDASAPPPAAADARALQSDAAASETGAPPTDAAPADAPSADGASRGHVLDHCSASAECVDGPNPRCLLSFAGPFCSHDCTTDDDCGGRGVCFSHLCLPTCSLGSQECDEFGGACAAAGVGQYVCMASCFETSPAGLDLPTCRAPLRCDPYIGLCLSSPRTGAGNGAPCRAQSDCRGVCVTELDASGSPSGYLDGMCISFGRMLELAAFQPGMDLPQSNCPAGSAIVPTADASHPGDSVMCLPTCHENTDCRPGYECKYAVRDGARLFTNSACVPIDCAAAGASCPAGFSCRVHGASGVCARDAAGADAGP